MSKKSENLPPTNQTIEEILQKIVDSNPYGFILRPELPPKTGGLIKSSAYIANLDSLGRGIEGRFMVGNTTAYPVDSVIKFLRKKISTCPTIKTPLPPRENHSPNIKSGVKKVTGPFGDPSNTVSDSSMSGPGEF